MCVDLRNGHVIRMCAIMQFEKWMYDLRNSFIVNAYQYRDSLLTHKLTHHFV